MSKSTKIWDLPTRIFHIALALLVMCAFITVNLGDDWMKLHGQIGLSILALLSFRLVWGVFGGYWSRFSSFPLHPKKVMNHLRDKSRHSINYPGHNPLGSLSTLVMLLAFTLQALTGLCSDDEVLFSGPLTTYLTSSQVEFATYYHSEIGQPLILILIGLHVLAILLYKFVFKQNLVTPMITGFKEDLQDCEASQDNFGSRVFGLFIFFMIFSLLFYFLPI